MLQDLLSAGSRFSQQGRLFRLHSPLGDDLLLDRFQGREGLSEPFRFTLDLLSERADLSLLDLMGQELGVELAAGDQPRRFGGRVVRFAHTGSDGGFAHYRAVLGPWTEFLARRASCRIFHDLALPDLLRRLFGEYGTLARYQLDLEAEYRPVAQVTQYGETDFAFLSRLLEAQGIHYRFRFDPDGHTLVLADGTGQAPPVPGTGRIAYNTEPGAGGRDGIDRWGCGQDLVATDYAIRSYDFQQPRDRLVVHRAGAADPGGAPRLECYEHDGAYAYRDYEDGQRLARLRAEEADLRAQTWTGAGTFRHLASGHSFELEGHYGAGAGVHDRRFLVLAVEHEGASNVRDPGAAPTYRNRFTCVRRSVPYRPPRTTPRPVVRGPQTATVVGPAGEEIFCDPFGRVKVQFHWDREGGYDDGSSAWVRVATPLAGARFGMVALPRIGQEVVAAFLEGDPDRPMIVGQAYNALHMPPWDLPAGRTQTGLLSRSTPGGGYEHANALRFEDRKGAEEVWLHAEKDQRIEVEHDESHHVGQDRTKAIGRDETTRVGRDRREQVERDERIRVGHDRTETVGHDETVTVGAHRKVRVEASESLVVGAAKTETVALASAEQVGGVRSLTVGGAYLVSVAAAKNEAVGAASIEEVGLGKTTAVGKTYTITAGDRLEIQVGKAKLVMTRDGAITLSGTDVRVEASGPVSVAGKDVHVN